MSKYSILENKDKKNILMKNNPIFYVLFFFQLPFFLIWKIIKYSLYYFIIIIFLITLFIYISLPIKHNIFIIYKLLFLVKKLIKILCLIDPEIIFKSNNYFFNYNNSYVNDINSVITPNKKHLIYTQINSFFDIILLLKLVKQYQFLIHFQNKKNFYTLEKKIANYIENLQIKSINIKNKNNITIIICSKIPNDIFFKNNYNKNKIFFILLPQKDKTAILYSKNNI